MILQLLFVLAAIIVGARLGGIGLGVMGGAGMAVLVFVFGLEPTSPPIDVMLMIAAVISAAAAMQAAGGLDYLVGLAEKMLRKHPSQVTIVSPLVTYLFTLVAGTGHVAYSVLPVIAEVARETKIRPERPLGIAVIASQQAITASPFLVRYPEDNNSRHYSRCAGRSVFLQEGREGAGRRSRVSASSQGRDD